jgi:hypothetical protein
MLQVNVGKLVYPDYQIITTQPLFKDIEAFERCEIVLVVVWDDVPECPSVSTAFQIPS